ncbi:MAG: hypothetical protein ACRD3J_05995, partial [Thermoanaerobaculia bacterium]
MSTTFAGVVGQTCWMVSARAVASIGNSSVAQCSFCSLDKNDDNHTLLIKGGANLRVDGDIYVNSISGAGKKSEFSPCIATWDGKKKDHVCGDGFDLFGDAPSISAKTIAVAGGWEEQGDNGSAITQADGYAQVNGANCPSSLDPNTEPPGQKAKGFPAKVCVAMPFIADPLNDAADPANIITAPVAATLSVPVAGLGGCPPTGVTLPGQTVTGNTTICPGLWNGGFKASCSCVVTMKPGVYYMAGGGFAITGSASIDGSAGVMIYNSGGVSNEVSTPNPGADLLPAGNKTYDPKTPTLTVAPAAPALNAAITLTFTIDKSGTKGAP